MEEVSNMVEPIIPIHTNRCAICNRVINSDKEYYCLNLAYTSEEGDHIYMDSPLYGYICMKCGNNLKNLFKDEED